MLSGVETHGLEASLLGIIVLTFTVGAILAYTLQKLHLPSFLAFILTGMIMGPEALNLIRINEIRPLAQIGIIFLLFIVGLDLSLDKLKQLRYQAPLAGVLQLALTTAVLMLSLRYLTSMPWQLAFMLGSILSLSSTAIVLKSLEEHREIDSDHGRLILGILIIQDLSIIPLMALIPYLSSPLEANMLKELLVVLLKAFLFGAVSIFLSLKIVPIFLDRIASTNRKEIFTLALLCIGLGMALFTHVLGLSYEAGAFVAGLALSQSLFCRQIISDSKAFRDVFITLFFISMGLQFNTHFLLSQFGLVCIATALLIFLKGCCAFGAVRMLRFPQKTAAWTGISLFQVGEFSFVLLGRSLETFSHVSAWQQLLSFWSPVLIDAIIISMFLTPIVLRQFQKLSTPGIQILRKPTYADELGKSIKAADQCALSLPRHVIIAGYGPIARNLVLALEQSQISYSVIEMNLKSVRILKEQGVHCVYGDVSRIEILEEAGVKEAGILAITFPDIRTAESAVREAKQLNPGIQCLVRSRYQADMEHLYKIGTDHVIYEEFETSLSFIFNVLTKLNAPILETERMITLMREAESSTNPELQNMSYPIFGRFNLLEGSKIEWAEIQPDCKLIGKTLGEAKIRNRTGVNIIAVVNAQDHTQIAAEAELRLNANDVLVGVGTLEQLHALENLLYGQEAL